MAAPIVRVVQASGVYLPVQWSKPAMVSITVPAGTAASQNAGAANPATGVYTLHRTSQAATTYVFDAVLSLEHEQSLTKTQHPVQNSASVSSHAYVNPARLTLAVLMSDVAGVYSRNGVAQWSGNASKSVSAYQTMLTLQLARVPLNVATRIRNYANMIIVGLEDREDDKTITGARFRVELEQIFIANTQAAPSSSRPNDTASTGQGSVNVTPPSAAVNTQFGVPATASVNQLNVVAVSDVATDTAVNIPGAGAYSSVPQQFGGVAA